MFVTEEIPITVLRQAPYKEAWPRPQARTLGVGKPPDSKACVFSLEAKREEKGATLVEVGSLLVPSRLAESYKLFIRHFNACLD